MSNTTNSLSAEEKRNLKARAHGLKPVVLIGDKGLTDAVIEETNTALMAHGLIKIRVTGDDRASRIAISEKICTETGAQLIQHIGKLLVLYRPIPENSAKNGSKKPGGKKARVTKRQMNA